MEELTGRDRLLVDQVTAALRKADQFEATLEAEDTDAVEKLRSIGRRVGRELGWRVRTFATTLDIGRVRVLILVEQSTPLRDDLMNTRRQKLMRSALEHVGLTDNCRPAD